MSEIKYIQMRLLGPLLKHLLNPLSHGYIYKGDKTQTKLNHLLFNQDKAIYHS